MKPNIFLIILLLIIIFKDSILYLFNDNPKVYINQNLYLNKIEKEYEELLKINNINYNYKIDYINSKIIFRDIYNYMNEVTINKGKDDLIKENSLVIYNNTLVGKIKKVNKNTSIVTLLTNKNSKISVKINNEIGLLTYNNTFIIKDISNYGNINIGDKVYTSNINYLDNIYIGKVKDIIYNENKIEKIIYMEYDIDINNINYLTILNN